MIIARLFSFTGRRDYSMYRQLKDYVPVDYLPGGLSASGLSSQWIICQTGSGGDGRWNQVKSFIICFPQGPLGAVIHQYYI
jgi:hypothetical protein